MRALLLLVPALALTGCPSKKDDAPPPAPVQKRDIEPSEAGVPAWSWPAAQVTAATLCQAMYAPNADIKDACARSYDPSAGARTYMEETLADCVPRVERSVLNGRADLVQPAAQTCVTKLLELRRSGRALVAGTEWEHACDGALVGKVAPGEACKEAWECTEGFTCRGWSKTKTGKCTTASNLNAPCTAVELRLHPVHECVQNAYCAADTCKPVDKENETCGPDSCAEGTFCSSGLHKCVKSLATAGAKCLRHEDCAVGLYCDVDRCAQQKAGGKCLDSIECQGDCKSGACVPRCK